MTPPDVSVIIPAYNAAPFLGQAIASIKSQQHSRLEILVVDDASQDQTASLAKHHGANLIQLPQNLGTAAARNAGIAQAQGELIAFLDADDLWSPHKLERQVAALKRFPQLQGVTSLLRPFSQDAGWLAAPQPNFIPSFGTALLRRQVFGEIGLCNPIFRLCDDVDWFNRAREVNIRLALMPQALLFYRQHQNNISKNSQQVSYWMARAFQARLQRFGYRPPHLPDVPYLELV
jgi:glycosyltransferase involved in cell wall biosynthesis